MSWEELTAYAGVFAALVAAGLGFPIPEEVPIVAGGVLAGQADHERLPKRGEVVALLACDPSAGWPGAVPWAALHQCAPEPDRLRVRWWLMLPVCILGVVLSDGLLYGAGRLFGSRLLRMSWFARLLPPAKREKIEHNFHLYGIKILLFARLLPGIRAPIFITAGMMRLPLKRFLLADGIYAIPGVSLLFFLAYWFTTSFQELVMWAEEKVIHYGRLVTLVLIAAVVTYLFYNYLRSGSPTGDPEELPLVGKKVASHIIPAVKTEETAGKGSGEEESEKKG